MFSSVTKKARGLRANATEAEKKLWTCLQRGQLGVKFRRQYPIQSYIVDFCCLNEKLIIEVDGGQHNENKYDKMRDQDLKTQGYTVLRFWNNEVLSNVEGVVLSIKDVLGHIPPLPPRKRGGISASSRKRESESGFSSKREGASDSSCKKGEETHPQTSPRLRGDKGGNEERGVKR